MSVTGIKLSDLDTFTLNDLYCDHPHSQRVAVELKSRLKIGYRDRYVVDSQII